MLNWGSWNWNEHFSFPSYTRASSPLQYPPEISQEITLGNPKWLCRTGMLVDSSVVQLSGGASGWPHKLLQGALGNFWPAHLLPSGASWLEWRPGASWFFTMISIAGTTSTKPGTDLPRGWDKHWQEQLWPGGSCTQRCLPRGRATARLLRNTSLTSECNFNLLEEATYFLKLIAIFVDLAWLFWGKGKEAENQLLGSVVKKKKSIFLVTMRSLFWSLYVNKTWSKDGSNSHSSYIMKKQVFHLKLYL